MNEDKDTPFLARWARRKAEVREGKPVPAEPLPVVVAPASPAPPAAAEVAAPPPPEPPPLTLDDVARLDTKTGDFTRSVRPSVTPEVKNAALHKLFHADPHFNVMDGLDTYIDDYNKPDPLPAGMLRKMAQAQFLGLFTEDEDKDAKPAAPDDQDADLRLQPDDAAGRPGLEPSSPGSEPDDGREH
jgi:hypothetical protein